MSDVIVQFPVRAGREAQLFGSYLSAFLDRLSKNPALQSADADAPWLMVRSDPLQDVDIKVLTFQQASDASDFSTGWAQALSGLPSR